MSETPPLTFLRADELTSVAEIEAMVFPQPLSLPELQKLFEAPGTVYVGFHVAGRLAAYFGFQVAGPTAQVISNATHPDFRRRGLGSAILTRAEPLARKQGARWFLGWVRASNAAQFSVLEKIRWHQVGRCPQFFDNGEDAVVVWRCF